MCSHSPHIRRRHASAISHVALACVALAGVALAGVALAGVLPRFAPGVTSSVVSSVVSSICLVVDRACEVLG